MANELTIESLGLSTVEIENKIVERAVEKLLEDFYEDEEEGELSKSSKFQNVMRERIRIKVATHTPGPWRFEETNSARLSLVVVDLNHGNGNTVIIGQIAGPDRYANAPVLAAAPDMLEVLKFIMADAAVENAVGMHTICISHKTVIDALAAIAKAEGNAA